MVRRSVDLSPGETAMASLDACVIAERTNLCTTPEADAGSIQRPDSEMQLLAGCHSRRQQRVLPESPMSSRGQCPHLCIGMQDLVELQDVVQENLAVAVLI